MAISIFFFGQRWRATGLGLIIVGLIAMSFFAFIAINFLYIAIGALYSSSAEVRNAINRLATRNFIAISAVVITVHPLIASFSIHHITGAVQPALLAVIFFGTINGVGPFVRLVSMEWLRRIGVISYSLYLWQQLSTGTPDLYGAHSVMLLPVLFIGPAIFSYWLIERPMIQIGHRLSDAIRRRRGPNDSAGAKRA